jgi:tRNA-2-methylthio-N6-dimethylallyladenosine synthase
MNKSDSSKVSNALIKSGYIEVENNQDADIIIINTCSVRQSAENRIWGRLGFYKNLKSKKDIILLLIGCMAQRLGEQLLSLNESIDIVVGAQAIDKIPEIINNYKKGIKSVCVDENKIFFDKSIPDKENPKKAFVTISHGCNNYCSYCIVPYLRGKEVSRISRDIIKDINQLTEKGVIQVTLLGQNVNSYGTDINDVSFPKLLKKISIETDIKWIKYLSSHPKDFTDELIDVIINENKVSNWLHLAVQSGSNKVLKEMNRNYKIEYYIEKIEKLKKYIPDLNLTTDILVGFPGEAEKDFLNTINLLKRVEFDDAYMYKYNIREGTLAYKNMPDTVSADEKTKRLSLIIELQKKITRKNKLKRINNIFEVISDKWSKKSNNEILGLTKEDLMIVFKGKQENFNDIIKVKATALRGNTLFGEIINE